jgi:hypothetical protein
MQSRSIDFAPFLVPVGRGWNGTAGPLYLLGTAGITEFDGSNIEGGGVRECMSTI